MGWILRIGKKRFDKVERGWECDAIPKVDMGQMIDFYCSCVHLRTIASIQQHATGTKKKKHGHQTPKPNIQTGAPLRVLRVLLNLSPLFVLDLMNVID